MKLLLLPDDYAICKVDTAPLLPLPTIIPELYSITVTDEETSIVCPEAFAPKDGAHERGYRALRIAGKIPFGAVGILAGLTATLAEAKVPVFALSTYTTDYLLVHHTRLDEASAALIAAGHSLHPAEEA